MEGLTCVFSTTYKDTCILWKMKFIILYIKRDFRVYRLYEQSPPVLALSRLQLERNENYLDKINTSNYLYMIATLSSFVSSVLSFYSVGMER